MTFAAPWLVWFVVGTLCYAMAAVGLCLGGFLCLWRWHVSFDDKVRRIGNALGAQTERQEQIAGQLTAMEAQVVSLGHKLDELAGNVESVAEGMNLLLGELARALDVSLDDAPSAQEAAKSRKQRG